ncbi:MAG: hypothetical protein Q9174_005694 [Haloplaca sp. 1 TL-2023]
MEASDPWAAFLSRGLPEGQPKPRSIKNLALPLDQELRKKTSKSAPQSSKRVAEKQPERQDEPFRFKSGDRATNVDPFHNWATMDQHMIAHMQSLRNLKIDKNHWEDVHKVDASAQAEHLYSDSDDEQLDSKAAREKYIREQNSLALLAIEDEAIYDAWKSGSEAVDRLRSREQRGILAVYGKPPKRPITQEDCEALYSKYEQLFNSPGHLTSQCTNCYDWTGGDTWAFCTVFKQERWGEDKSTVTWHFSSKASVQPIKSAYIRYEKACKGLDRQIQQAKDREPIIAENKEREKKGNKPIPLDELRVDRFVRELEEDPDIATTYEAAKQRKAEKEEHFSEEQQRKEREHQEQEKQRELEELRERNERFLDMYLSSSTFLSSRSLTCFYPFGLPYKGKLVHNIDVFSKEDRRRLLHGDRDAFVEEMGKTLPKESQEKKKWDAWVEKCSNDPAAAFEERKVMTKEVLDGIKGSQDVCGPD